MDAAAWIDAFVLEMARQGSSADPDLLNRMAMAYHDGYGTCDPSTIARKRVEQFGLPDNEAALDQVIAALALMDSRKGNCCF